MFTTSYRRSQHRLLVNETAIAQAIEMDGFKSLVRHAKCRQRNIALFCDSVFYNDVNNIGIAHSALVYDTPGVPDWNRTSPRRA